MDKEQCEGLILLKKGETKLYKIGGGIMKENAGHSNLIPASKLTPEERRENGRKGGIASGIARNERKTLKEHLLILLENIFPPIPSELILLFGGFMTTYTKLNIIGMIISSTLGSLIGALLLYKIGTILK